MRCNRCAVVKVRRCTAADMEALRQEGAVGLRHHEHRFAAQQRGWCDFLLAFNEGTRLVGHAVVRSSSKYEPVIEQLGSIPEINGLAAYPTGTGTGTALLDAGEDVVKSRGASRVGIAVERTNQGARRLYERHAYVEWDHGDVIDDWDEVANDGTVLAHHHEVCAYLVLELSQGEEGPCS